MAPTVREEDTLNAFLYGRAVALNEPAAHAWAVLTDHGDGTPHGVGTVGPGQAPDHLCEALQAGPGARPSWRWTTWDDDGNRCHSGVLVTEHATPEDDETGANGALSAPLTDYCEGGCGAVRITWSGHPEWEVG